MGSFGLWLSRGSQKDPLLDTTGEDINKGPNPRAGVGLIMAAEETGSVFISDLAPHSAAWHSSLCIGDRITHIDGVHLKNKCAASVNDLLLGPEGSLVQLRIEAKASTDTKGSSLCKPARKSQQKSVYLMRGRSAFQNQVKMEGTIQVNALEAAQCAGKVSFGLLCMPTEHVIYSFMLSLHGLRWDLHKRYSDFVQIDRRLRAAFSDSKLDLLLGPSRLPGKAFLDKTSSGLIQKRKQRLELYIRALVAHRAIAKSDMLRNFLQLPDELYSTPAADNHAAARRRPSASGSASSSEASAAGGGAATSIDSGATDEEGEVDQPLSPPPAQGRGGDCAEGGARSGPWRQGHGGAEACGVNEERTGGPPAPPLVFRGGVGGGASGTAPQ